MPAVITVDVVDELEIPAPLVHPEEVEVGGADKEDRRLVAMKKAANVRDASECFFLSHRSLHRLTFAVRMVA
jgi:hypothetical protein